MEFEGVLGVVSHRSPSALPLHQLVVLLVVPALRLIEGHEEQRELPH